MPILALMGTGGGTVFHGCCISLMCLINVLAKKAAREGAWLLCQTSEGFFYLVEEMLHVAYEDRKCNQDQLVKAIGKNLVL